MDSNEGAKAALERDPVDAILPKPFSWWKRLLIAGLVMGVALTGSMTLGRGNVYPNLNFVENTFTSGPLMRLADGGDAVVITVDFVNGGTRDVRINSAKVELPGAEIISLDARYLLPIEDQPGVFLISTGPLPVVATAGSEAAVLITFIPTACDDVDEPWGRATINVSVANSRLPSLRRSYDLGPVVGYDGFGIDDERFPNSEHTSGPLAAACALLDQ